MKLAYWIQRTHLLRADEYICSACDGVCAAPAAVCPCCGRPMKNGRDDLHWIDEAEGYAALLEDDW